MTSFGYTQNMSDPSSPEFSGPRTTRRNWLKLVGGALATLLVGKQVAEMASQPNVMQQRAAEALQKASGNERFSFQVQTHEDIIKNNGLSARDEARISPPNEPPNTREPLQPGDIIKDAIYWKGPDPDNPARIGDYWLAFKNDQGEVRFVGLRKGYLEQVPKQNPQVAR